MKKSEIKSVPWKKIPKIQAQPSLIKVRCSVSHVRSSVSKSQGDVRNVRGSVCQCSKCSVFGILVFVPPLIRCQSPKYENGFLTFMALGVG